MVAYATIVLAFVGPGFLCGAVAKETQKYDKKKPSQRTLQSLKSRDLWWATKTNKLTKTMGALWACLMCLHQPPGSQERVNKHSDKFVYY